MLLSLLRLSSLLFCLTAHMGTLLWPPPPPPAVISVSGKRPLCSTFPPGLPETRHSRGKARSKILSSKFESFINLKPESNPESLNLDLQWFDPSTNKSSIDVIIIGAGPTWLRLAEQVSRFGIPCHEIQDLSFNANF